MNKIYKEHNEEFLFKEIEDRDNTELMDIVFILMKEWRVIIASTVVVTLIGIVFALRQPYIYSAKAKLMISNNNYSARGLDARELNLNQRLVTTYTEIAKNREVSQTIIKKFGLEITPEAMGNKIGVEPVRDTEFINITYKDKDPHMAAVMCNEVSGVFIVRVKELMGVQNLKIIEQAEVPIHPSGMSKWQIVIFSIGVGAVLGTFIAFVVDIFTSTLRKPSEIEKIMGCSIIGTIPDFEDLEDREVKKNVKQ